MRGTNSRGLPVSRGQTVGEPEGSTRGRGAVGGRRESGPGPGAVGGGSLYLRPASPCFPQYVRNVSYVAGNGGDAARYASQTRCMV